MKGVSAMFLSIEKR